jgi:hypothetical protein
VLTDKNRYPESVLQYINIRSGGANNVSVEGIRVGNSTITNSGNLFRGPPNSFISHPDLFRETPNASIKSPKIHTGHSPQCKPFIGSMLVDAFELHCQLAGCFKVGVIVEHYLSADTL